jgi:hypothetical protein
MKSIFRAFADKTAEETGSPWAFFVVVVLTAAWLAAHAEPRYACTAAQTG